MLGNCSLFFPKGWCLKGLFFSLSLLGRNGDAGRRGLLGRRWSVGPFPVGGMQPFLSLPPFAGSKMNGAPVHSLATLLCPKAMPSADLELNRPKHWAHDYLVCFMIVSKLQKLIQWPEIFEVLEIVLFCYVLVFFWHVCLYPVCLGLQLPRFERHHFGAGPLQHAGAVSHWVLPLVPRKEFLVTSHPLWLPTHWVWDSPRAEFSCLQKRSCWLRF